MAVRLQLQSPAVFLVPREQCFAMEQYSEMLRIFVGSEIVPKEADWLDGFRIYHAGKVQRFREDPTKTRTLLC